MITHKGSSRIAAFFDFDKTLLDTESSRLGFRYLWERRMISIGFLLKVITVNFFYQRHWISDEKMAKILIRFYRNKRLEDFQKGSSAFYHQQLKPHLAPNILARARSHRQEGHVLVLISGSVRYLLKPVVEDLDFDHLVCTDLETGPDGLLTGRSKGPICLDSNKRMVAEKLAENKKIDLKSSYAYGYGNHQADLPLLKLVGHPLAVEPTEPLKKVALQKQWPILTYR